MIGTIKLQELQCGKTEREERVVCDEENSICRKTITVDGDECVNEDDNG